MSKCFYVEQNVKTVKDLFYSFWLLVLKMAFKVFNLGFYQIDVLLEPKVLKALKNPKIFVLLRQQDVQRIIMRAYLAIYGFLFIFFRAFFSPKKKMLVKFLKLF